MHRRRHNPDSDSWTPTGLTNVPRGRIGHTVVWTGDEMIVWGGVDETFFVTDTGGRYDPRTQLILTSTVNAAAARSGASECGPVSR